MMTDRDVLCCAGIGVGAVLGILAVSWGFDRQSDASYLTQVATLARAQINDATAKVDDMRFQRPSRAALTPQTIKPLNVCGYVNGRRFEYDHDANQITVDNVPGIGCDPVRYPY